MLQPNPDEFVRKDAEDETSDDVVMKAVTDLAATVEDRLGKMEAKADDKALADRLTKLEAKANRASGKPDEAAPSDERKAFAAYLARGDSAPDVKVLTVADDPAAGYLAPAEMSQEFIRDLVEFSPVRTVASVRTTTAPAVIYPKRTSITNAHWVGEIEERPASEPTFGQAQVDIHELATFVDLSKQLLSDSGGQAETEVRTALAEDFGLKEAQAFLYGDGKKKPLGLMVDPLVPTVANGAADAVASDALVALFYSLPAMYRNRGAWAMNGAVLGHLRTIRDGDGNYLWRPGLTEGQPETILGRPVVEMVDLPDVTPTETPIVFGDWSGYRIVDRLALDTLVDPYTQATRGITRIHARRRVGGRVLEPLKFRKLSMEA